MGGRILDYLHARGEALDITAPSPVKAVYVNARGVDWENPDVVVRTMADAGVSMIILAFYLSDLGAVDLPGVWEKMTPARQIAAVAYAHARGAVVLVSAGGSTDLPYLVMNGSTLGHNVATWAVANNLDGVDFDLENFGQGFAYEPLTEAQTIQWVVDASIAARNVLCAQRFITHAPQVR